MADLPAEALAALCCPHCRAPLQLAGRLLECSAGHRFDLARQGYVSLLGSRSRTDTGDDADMVAARVEFLGAGHYAPIAAAVAEAVGEIDGLIGDLGAGPGYYLSAVAGADRPGLAVDSSKYAARRAAAVPHVLSVVADNWSALPIADQALAAVLSIFAPRDLGQMHRVLRPGGLLVAVTPEPGHLAQVRGPLRMLAVDEGKADRLDRAAAGFEPVRRQSVRFQVLLDHAGLSALVRMGPAARHATRAEIEAAVARQPDSVPVTVDVTVSVLCR